MMHFVMFCFPLCLGWKEGQLWINEWTLRWDTVHFLNEPIKWLIKGGMTSFRREGHRDNWLHWDIPSAHKTTYMLQQLIRNNVILALEKYIDRKYLGNSHFCRLELSVPELIATAFPSLNEGWQNPAVQKHLSLGYLQSQAPGVLPEPEQNPWLKEESLGLGHKNQRPYQNSNGILFSTFLNGPLKVCMPGCNLSKEIKNYCYINTNTPGMQKPARITLHHTGCYLQG